MNSFGIRIRHEVLQNWLLSDRTVESAIEAFPTAAFDPEFNQNYHAEIQAAFQHQFSH